MDTYTERVKWGMGERLRQTGKGRRRRRNRREGESPASIFKNIV